MPEIAGRSSVAMMAQTAIGDTEKTRAGQIERIAYALHEMCQPLMALQCRLEIGRMIGTAEGYEEAVRESLTECDRLLATVDLLRDEIRQGLEASRG